MELLLVLLAGFAGFQACHATGYKPTSPPHAYNQSVCYPVVGCFNNMYPFNNTGTVLPNPPELVGTDLWLYNRDRKTEYATLRYDDDGKSIQASGYEKGRPLKFIIHGFSNSGSTPWIHNMKDALLKYGDFNVIVVHWGPGSRLPDYLQAVANTRLVAKQLSLLLELIISQTGLQLSDVHLIGHSLGAHASGYVGASFNGKIGRISGMDPAEPNFEFLDKVVRLNKDDAQFVDVIHSNGAPLYRGGAGMFQECGHVDFYPNGGESQPGCPPLVSGILGSILSGKAGEIGDLASCSHARSHDLFTESIVADRSQCTFWSYPCASYEDFTKGKCFFCSKQGCSEMGYHADEHTGRGKYYLATAGSPSYCGNSYILKVDTAAIEGTDTPIKGVMKLTLTGTAGEESLQYKGEHEELPYGTSDSPIVVHSQLGPLTKVQISYTYYEGTLFSWGEGVKSFDLSGVTLLTPANDKFSTCASSVTVQSGKSVTVKFC